MQSTAADIIEALFSIYLATDPRRPAAPLPLEPAAIGLAEAARIIQADGSGIGRSRRVRLIARLAASGGPGAHDAELEILGAPIDAIREIVLGAEGAAFSPPIERRIYDLVASLDSGLAPCPRVPPKTTSTLDPQTEIVTAVTTTGVRRSLAEVRAVLDPQNWDTCFSLFFAKAFVALQVNGEYPTDANGDAQEKSGAPLPGCPWQDVLFEHFQLRYSGLMWFKNLLQVTCAANECTYELHTSIRSAVGLSRMNGGVLVDHGGIAWQQAGDWVNITATKHFKLGPRPGYPSTRPLNYLTCLNLEMMGDTLHDGLCCAVAEGCP